MGERTGPAKPHAGRFSGRSTTSGSRVPKGTTRAREAGQVVVFVAFSRTASQAPTSPTPSARSARRRSEDASLIWGLIPLFPDLKRKARVQIEEVDGLTGLLPIAVRLPQPLSAAAVFYDERDRDILAVSSASARR
jgi:hypothetical protein